MQIPRFDTYVGLDPSLTSTGLALSFLSPAPEVGHRIPEVHRIQTSPRDFETGRDAKGARTSTWRDRYMRLENIADRVALRVPEGSLVLMEAPSYGSTSTSAHDRAGLWWLLYEALAVTQGCRVVPVSPSQRMMYATGTGRADKDAVLAAVVKRYTPLEFDVTGNDVADAVVFAAMAARMDGRPFDGDLPATHLRAMDKLEPIDGEVLR